MLHFSLKVSEAQVNISMLTIDKQAIEASLSNPNITQSDRTKLLESLVTSYHSFRSSSLFALFSFQEKIEQKLESTQLWVTLYHPADLT